MSMNHKFDVIHASQNIGLCIFTIIFPYYAKQFAIKGLMSFTQAR